MTQNFGLAAPFQRDRKRDFAAATGNALRRSQVLQVLLTRQGELPWDTRFGSGLHTLRQARGDAATCALARNDVLQALHYAMPTLPVREVTVTPVSAGLRVEVTITGATGTDETITVETGGNHAAPSSE